MMKKLVIGMSLIIGLSSVSQAHAAIWKTVSIFAVGTVAGALLYKYYGDEKDRVKDQAVIIAADEGAVLKRR